MQVAAPTSLPLWAQIGNLAVTLILASLTIFGFFRKGKVQVRITRDCFFRLTNIGETFFCHAVLLARYGPVLILDATITLRRRGGRDVAEKSFPLEILNFGEKVKGPQFTAEHHFYGKSPLMFVPADIPQRPVYWCVHREYHARQQGMADRFGAEVQKLANAFREERMDRPTVQREIQVLAENWHPELVRLIQLEAGTYEVNLTLNYERLGSFRWRRKHCCSSRIQFIVEPDRLEFMKADLLHSLVYFATNTTFNANLNLLYPEYAPKNFEEL